MTQAGRVDLADGCVLHSYAYRETSLILDLFTRDHGRLSVVARGARRPTSSLRTVLLPFQPLQLSWFGKSELKTLHKAEWVGGVRMLAGEALICGYYLNELLLALLPKEDPTPALFEHYLAALWRLSQGEALAPVLREFELTLLMQTGYGLTLDCTADGEPVQSGRVYRYRLQTGVLPLSAPMMPGDLELAGATLLDLVARRFDEPRTLNQSRALMRYLLAELLPDRALTSRDLLSQLHRAG